MFIILQKSGERWIVPHRSPHAGPFDSLQEAEDEIDRYRSQWPEDTMTFAVFVLLAKRLSKKKGGRDDHP